MPFNFLTSSFHNLLEMKTPSDLLFHLVVVELWLCVLSTCVIFGSTLQPVQHSSLRSPHSRWCNAGIWHFGFYGQITIADSATAVTGIHLHQGIILLLVSVLVEHSEHAVAGAPPPVSAIFFCLGCNILKKVPLNLAVQLPRASLTERKKGRGDSC